MKEQITKDSVADGMFQTPYSQLSAWGKRHVDEVWEKFNRIDAPRTAGLPGETETAKLRKDNERLASKLESAQMENLDLWDENTELKAELTALQEQFNLPST